MIEWVQVQDHSVEWGKNMNILKLPLGVDSFEKIKSGGYYYVDKTDLIVELLHQSFEVNLITRPRRFGKTLMMSMLSDFFDIRKDSRKLFEGLLIWNHETICQEYMNEWPVLFLTLKDVAGLDFKGAYGLLQVAISSLCVEHSYLEKSVCTDESDRKRFAEFKSGNIDDKDLKSALFVIMRMMCAHYGKPVILLIDEYDVPLAQASEHGYYEEMLGVMQSLLGMALKTNPYLKFAVVTGCLRIAKESIFTGTNNFVSSSISTQDYSSSFGFTQKEVLKVLETAGLSEHASEMKVWYDGYRFGSKEVYCPWDVLNHIFRLMKEPDARPVSYWKNTSHNGIIRSFIEHPGLDVRDKFEVLLAGGTIFESICEDLTYDVLHSTEENLWSVLYLTGYLTQADPSKTDAVDWQDGRVGLKIPNEEVKTIFAQTISEWFVDRVQGMKRDELFRAWWTGEEEILSRMLTDILFETISYYDYKEDYYHAFLAGLFAGAGYRVVSNAEKGTGRPDVVVMDRQTRSAIIIEIKHSHSYSALDKDCRNALDQIDARQYARQFMKGYRTVLCYGAAFYEKECRIRKIELNGSAAGTVYDIE